MTDELTIRPARDGDREFVADFASILLEFGSPAWPEAKLLEPGFREVLARAVDDAGERTAVLIAESTGGRRLGFISLKVRPDVTGTDRAHVADLAVAADARRLGVGSALMEAAEEWARGQGLATISLEAWSTNERALAFYRELGFRPESLCLYKEVGPVTGARSPRAWPGSAAGPA